ncbi:MAG TPA: hypothetical protein VFX76_09410 [Roseiflexaceae bacterium]|nr:hypothetical protein [Roseiflexaceae bacterium]
MSDVTPEPDTTTPEPSRPAWRRWLLAALPYALTALLAVAISLGLQSLLFQPTSPTFIVSATAALPPSTAVATAPPAAPTSSVPAPEPDIVRQELLDLRAEDDRLWAAVYLARAISQVSDAEAQLRSNNLESVAQSLVAVDGSLELAYDRANDSAKSPIAELRRTTGVLRDDLYIRPEGMDARLTVLRQTILTLVGERR